MSLIQVSNLYHNSTLASQNWNHKYDSIWGLLRRKAVINTMYFSLWPSDTHHRDSDVHSVDCSCTVARFTLSFWIILTFVLEYPGEDKDTTNSLGLAYRLCSLGLKSSKSKVNMKSVIGVCNEVRSPCSRGQGPREMSTVNLMERAWVCWHRLLAHG